MTSFSSLVDASSRVSETSARTRKIRELANFLSQLKAREIELGVRYLSGEIAQAKLGVGFTALRAALLAAEASSSDFGGSLSIERVDAALAEISEARGAGSSAHRSTLLGELFARATRSERDFLMRLLSGELRQGALAGIMLEAIALATRIEPERLRRAAMFAPSLGDVARAALLDGEASLARFQLKLFSPVMPMLAQTATDPSEAFSTLGAGAVFEWKMDGARIQAHKQGDDVRIYTRSMNDVTQPLPEIVEAVRRLPTSSLVLDGEAVSFDGTGRPHPFQITMRRFGRKLDVDELRVKLPIQGLFFDCLYVDGRSIVGLPLNERLHALEAIVPPAMRFPRAIVSSAFEAEGFYRGALAAGHEGVMAKSPHSSYEAGNRGAEWLKIKRVHTLDLVVLAAEWGHGRRTGTLSNLHLGAFDAVQGAHVMLGKTFKGLTDEMLGWQTRELLARETHRDSGTVYVRPELVVEVAFNDLQASIRYPGGLALRLARVKRYRDDKSAAQADTMDAVRNLYSAAAGAGTVPS